MVLNRPLPLSCDRAFSPAFRRRFAETDQSRDRLSVKGASFADVKHYQRILKILSETDKIMNTITMDFTATA